MPKILESDALEGEKSLKALVAELAETGSDLRLVAIPSSPEGKQAMAKRRHDLIAAMRTLNFTVEALTEGYKFNDTMAQAKIQAIGRAVRLVQAEMDWLMSLISEGKPQ